MKKAVLALVVFLAMFTMLAGCEKSGTKTTRFDSTGNSGGEPAEKAAITAVAEGEVGIIDERLQITSFEGTTLKTSKAYNVIRGKAPKGTYKIRINDYTLTRYVPGAANWTYLAASRFSTLAKGENKYYVVALNKKGDIIDELGFIVNYEPLAATTLPGVGSNIWMSVFIALGISFSLLFLRRFCEKLYFLIDK